MCLVSGDGDDLAYAGGDLARPLFFLSDNTCIEWFGPESPILPAHVGMTALISSATLKIRLSRTPLYATVLRSILSRDAHRVLRVLERRVGLMTKQYVR
jgi:hypothetical protein